MERKAEIGFGLPKGDKIPPEYFKSAEYRSVAVGVHPMERGFDKFFGILAGGNNFVTARTPRAKVKAEEREAPIWRGRTEVAEDRHLTDGFAEEAVQFVARNISDPFFLYFCAECDPYAAAYN